MPNPSSPLPGRILLANFLPATLTLFLAACGGQPAPPAGLSGGAVLTAPDPDDLREKIARSVDTASPSVPQARGLAGVMGGARVRLIHNGEHELLLPLPQHTDSQVPLCYAIAAAPLEAGAVFKVREREEANTVITVRLRGRPGQEVRLDWAAVVLFVRPPVLRAGLPGGYLGSTACAQLEEPVTRIADPLWTENQDPAAYARNIQGWIGAMRPRTPPRSLDALAILASGTNTICTANANLAAALLRDQNIPARSLAVIPTIGHRLEMHREVEYHSDPGTRGGGWMRFDPSSLQAEVPLEPWRSVVMARTTLADEARSMRPRPGASLGSPYGQELEFLGSGLTLTGEDFFWTLGRPLAAFEAPEEAVRLARACWEAFLHEGRLRPQAVRAAEVTDAGAFLAALRSP